MVGFWIVLGKGFGFWGNGRRTMGYFGVFVLWEDEGKGVSNARWDKFWCGRYSRCFLLIMYEKRFFFFGSFTVWEVLIVQMLMILIFDARFRRGRWQFHLLRLPPKPSTPPPHPPNKKKEKEIEHYIKIWLHYIYILVLLHLWVLKSNQLTMCCD